MRPTRATFIYGGSKGKIIVYRDGQTEYYCDAAVGTNLTTPQRRVRRLTYDTNGDLLESVFAENGEYQHRADNLITVQSLNYL